MANRNELNLNKPKKEVKLSKHGFTPFQKILMYVSGAVLLAALILIVLGLIGDYAFIPNNVLKNASSAMSSALGFGLTLTWLGVFLLLAGSVLLAITLTLSSNSEEREADKQLRKSERLSALKEARKDMVVDVNVTTATETDTSVISQDVKVVTDTPKEE